MIDEAGRWHRVKQLFQDALDRPMDERGSFLHRACEDDLELQGEVESLLVAHAAAGSLAPGPVIEALVRDGAWAEHRLQRGARLGHYEILVAIGKGGMGEVWKARDTTLHRDVAIKMLPEEFAQDADRLARVEREARLLASLNHPNIATIHGLETHRGTRFLVLELVEGRTLADRLRRGPIPVDESLKLALQIADALEAAHEKGVVHRDLKPANIQVTSQGRVKVLDFGLAKAVAAPSDDGPILTAVSTEVGMIIGTAAYMSPEQARGEPVGRQADIWSFGVVLFELLTGVSPFNRPTAVDTIASVLGTSPDYALLPPDTPANVRLVIRRCLDKDRRRRWQHMGDVRIGVEEALVARPADALPGRRPRATAIALACVAMAAATAVLAAFLSVGSRGARAETSARFWVLPPAGSAFARGPNATFLALSPDGSQLALIAKTPTEAPSIWLRSLSDLDARPLPGTEGARSVFWSPDGRSLGFLTDDRLKRIDLAANALLIVCDVPSGGGVTGTWGSAGRIAFATVSGDTIFSVPATGGTPTVDVRPDESRGERAVQWPWFLSGAGRFVYVAGLRDGRRMLMLVTPGKAPRPIWPVESNVEWVDPDYLVFARRDGTLIAQRFDLSSERSIGEPLLIAQSVDYEFGPGRAMFTVSRSGNVAYQPQQFQRMLWMDRAGKAIELVGPPAEHYGGLRLSPDGESLLFSRMQSGTGSYDLWTRDLRRGIDRRQTSDPGNELGGVWLPDGRSIVYSADQGKPPPHVVRKDLVTETVDEWLPRSRFQLLDDVSPDGMTILFDEMASSGVWDISTLEVTGSHKRMPLFPSPFHALDARFSPDGRFVSFTSLDAGTSDVYLAPFPTGAKVAVSAKGGAKARWNRNGRELFYLSADRHLVAIPVRTRPTLELGTPVSLFTAEFVKGNGQDEFDVSADGQRFIAVVPVPDTPVAVVQHWTSDVGR